MKSLLFFLFVMPALGMQAQSWEKNFDFVDQCICGLSKVSKDGKIGYVTKQGKVVIKLIYNDGLTFSEGLVAVKSDGKWMYLDSTGKIITEAVFDDAMSFTNGLAVVSKGGLYGYINRKGELVIPCQFATAKNFSEGLAPAANAKGQWGFIDQAGNWVIKPQYDFTDYFVNNEARVMKGGKLFYIDKDNKVTHE